MARDSFKTFIPLSVENGARSSIIFSFFDLLAAIAAHGKMNGFGGRKLSRMAAWWAFEHKDSGSGFDGGYQEWLKYVLHSHLILATRRIAGVDNHYRAADAASHLFFAYLRTLAPQQQGPGTISMLPMSLQKLLQETEYPPRRPVLMQSSTYKVVMIVESVSPTPFSLLRRGNHFQYRESALQHLAEYEDPVAALTEECRRVLRAIAAANQTQAVSSAKHSTSLRDASWSRFEDIGFQSTADEDEDEDLLSAQVAQQPKMGLRTTPASGGNKGGRPTTPSWADFLSSGFIDDRAGSPTNLLPPDKILPPIDTQVRQRSAQSHRPRLESERDVEQGELASINRIDLDDAFWWVWMNSLAPEETPERKSAFGRCAVIETIIRNGRWLVFEEVVKGAAPEPQEGAYVAEKKSFFSWRRKDKNALSRNKSSAGKGVLEKGDRREKQGDGGVSKTSLGPDQQAKIQAAAQQLQAKQEREKRAAQNLPARRGRTDAELMAERTQSVMTLQPILKAEASPAMKWANKYDKDAIREAYLANANAGRGIGRTTMQTNGQNGYADDETPQPSPMLQDDRRGRALTPAPEMDEEPESVAASPAPPPKDEAPDSIDIVRDNMASPEPTESIDPDSPRQQHKKLHKDAKKGGGGFRRLFGRNRRNSKVPDNAPTDLNAFLASERGGPTPEPGAPQTPVKADTPQQQTPREQSPHRGASDSPQVEQSPESHAEPTYNPSMVSARENISRIDTHDAQEAQDEFSRFDQGPLQDQPAFAPEEDDDATPPPIQRHRTPTPPPQPEPEPEPAPEPVKKVKPRPRPVVEPQGTGQAPAIERWAQIRKNAADRAAAAQQQKKSEELPRPAPIRPEGESDTSGEESKSSWALNCKFSITY